MHHKRNQLLSSDAVGACGVLRVGEEVKILVSFKLKKWYDSIGEIRNGECFMSKGSLKLGGAVFWAAVYFCMMVFYTALDITVWRTDSIFCCILAHCGYNLISYIAMFSA